jgi:hypothetical protein
MEERHRADVYAPSLPRMLGLSRKPEVRQEKMIR